MLKNYKNSKTYFKERRNDDDILLLLLSEPFKARRQKITIPAGCSLTRWLFEASYATERGNYFSLISTAVWRQVGLRVLPGIFI